MTAQGVLDRDAWLLLDIEVDLDGRVFKIGAKRGEDEISVAGAD